MKKKFKLFSLFLALVIFISGCVKYDLGMEVGEDNSFTLSLTSAISKSMTESMGEGTTSTTDEEELEALKAKGFTVTEYEEGDWKGYLYTKKYPNIDDVSDSNPVTVNIADITDSEKEDINTFFQKTGNKYIANFIIDLTDEDLDSTETNETETETDNETSQYMQQIIDSMEFNYHITLPTKATSHNATSVSDDGKTLNWKLEYGKVNEVKFEFSLKDDEQEKTETGSTTNSNQKDTKKEDKDSTILYVVIGGIVVVAIVIIIILMNKKKTPPTSNSTVNNQNSNIPNMNNNVNNNFANPTMNNENPQPTSYAEPNGPVNPVNQVNEPTTMPPQDNNPPLN